MSTDEEKSPGHDGWVYLDYFVYDKKVPVKLKNKLSKTVVRPAMVYGSECWALRKQEEQRSYTTEIIMLRSSQGNTRKVRIKQIKIDHQRKCKSDAY